MALNLLEDFRPDICVLAGYMLILGGAMCRQFHFLNLHPALPDGPIGTWQGWVQGGDALTITVSDGSIPATAGAGAKADSRIKRRKVSVQPASMERLL